jgi:Allene oxide cyclase barrel like domain
MAKRSLVIIALLVAFALVVGWAAVASARSGTRTHATLHVIEHATTDTVVDIGDPGDSTGDVLTFHNEVFDSSDSHVVGTDQGECIRIDPAEGSWECRWITNLDGGTIAVEGQFLDTANTIVAITGGTGRYRKASGEMELLSRNGGTEFDFIFHLH